MIKFVTTLLLVFAVMAHACPVFPKNPADSSLVMFWNLENLFDPYDDSLNVNPSETEFSSRGKRHWTKARYQKKVDAISKSILWTGDSNGRLPDIIGVAEVENRRVLSSIAGSFSLSKAGYRVVHHESPDPRGIDVGLLYLPDRFKLLESKPLRIHDFATRDILLVTFERKSGGDTVAFLVNHHPSKYGGAGTSSRREEAMRLLARAVDSLENKGISKIVAMGDFNDTPFSAPFDIVRGKLSNLAESLALKGEGTIRFAGKWDLIDMFLVSDFFSESRMKIVKVPFLEARDNTHSGDKPARAYSGPRYVGGVSDHLPISLVIR